MPPAGKCFSFFWQQPFWFQVININCKLTVKDVPNIVPALSLLILESYLESTKIKSNSVSVRTLRRYINSTQRFKKDFLAGFSGNLL